MYGGKCSSSAIRWSPAVHLRASLLFCISFVSLDSTEGVILIIYTAQSFTGSPERSTNLVPLTRPQSRIRCFRRWTGDGQHVVFWGYKYKGRSPDYYQKPLSSKTHCICITWTEFFASTNSLSRTNHQTSEVRCSFSWSCNILVSSFNYTSHPIRIMSPPGQAPDPRTQWWCGHCKQGPMSNKYNSACVFCHYKKDYTAYSERPRTRK